MDKKHIRNVGIYSAIFTSASCGIWGYTFGKSVVTGNQEEWSIILMFVGLVVGAILGYGFTWLYYYRKAKRGDKGVSEFS
ncbi:MAG: hypothetical protein H7A23_11695 [Leptospiraceae bacterium]|nr:hypothetical protein [Leptospiraceae bacterium]MCP5495209.1 hypothetical protein [Leptospiraceae bacterium]